MMVSGISFSLALFMSRISFPLSMMMVANLLMTMVTVTMMKNLEDTMGKSSDWQQ